MKSKVVLIACLFLPVSGTCLSLSVGVGDNIPRTEVKVDGRSAKLGAPSVLLVGQLLYDASPNFSVGVEVNHFGPNNKGSGDLIPGLDATLSSKSSTFLALVKFSIGNQEKASPFFIAGAGISRNTISASGRPQPGLSWPDTGASEDRQLMDSTKTVGAAMFGLGIKIPLIDQLSIEGEARYTARAKADYDFSPFSQAYSGSSGLRGPLNSVDLIARMVFRL